MTIIAGSGPSKKGPRDARRHRAKQRELIKENLPGIIADESIITRKKGKKVRIPIRNLRIPRFRPSRDQSGGSIGVGQGKGKKGKIIGKRLKDDRPGSAGQEPGEDYIETEVPLEELMEMVMEDLGLPNLDQKSSKEIEVELGFKITGIKRDGPRPLLHKQETGRAALKNFWVFMSILEKKSGLDQLTCYRALRDAKGNLKKALELLEDSSQIENDEDKVRAFPIFLSEDDYRFLNIEEDITHVSRAVVIAMMDVSGSMTTMKKYLARSALFWLVNFLRKLYEQVEIRFIIHHSEAKIVDEDTFFKTGESGGTRCFTAYEKASQLIGDEYPTESWNVYVWHFSDGDDFNTNKTVVELAKLLDYKINMFGYCEISPNQIFSDESMLELTFDFDDLSTLLRAFTETFPMEESRKDDMLSLVGTQHPFLGVIMRKREDVWPTLRTFLMKDRRWNNGR